MRQWVWPIGLAVLLLAAFPLVGWLAVAAAIAVLLGGLVVGRWAHLPLVLALAGGVIGATSAIEALARHDPAEPRWWLGVVAVVLAVLAAAGAPLISRHPLVGRALIVVGALGGAVAINLFDINTFYVAAVPLWLIAAAAPSQVLHSHPSD